MAITILATLTGFIIGLSIGLLVGKVVINKVVDMKTKVPARGDVYPRDDETLWEEENNQGLTKGIN